MAKIVNENYQVIRSVHRVVFGLPLDLLE